MTRAVIRSRLGWLAVAAIAMSCLGIGWLGCAAEPELEPVAPLSVAAQWGDFVVGDRSFDIDKASQHKLVGDWAKVETSQDGISFAWALGDSSTFHWRMVRPRDLELELRGRPFSYQGAPTQTVRVDVNGTDVGSFDMEPGWHDYRVRVPAAAWHEGDNAVRLRYAHARAPRDVLEGSTDHRPLAASWARVRIAGVEPLPADQPSSPRVEADRIFFPWDSRIDVYLQLDPTSTPALDASWSFRGEGTLRVSVAMDRPEGGAAEVASAHAEPPDGPIPLELPFEAASEGEAVRVRLRLFADPAPGTAAGGIVLRDATILAPGKDESADTAPDEAATAAPPTRDELPVPQLFVLYVVDTLRADHLTAWRGDIELDVETVPTPRLDQLAAESVVFRQTLAQAPWTRASVASVLSGLWPPEHGAVDRDDSLPADVPVLPEILQQRGWRTEAVVTNVNITRSFGFDRGFDHFEYLADNANASRAHDAVARRLEEAARRRAEGDGGERLFLYVHVIDPHSPYDPPDRWRQALAPDASAEFADKSLQTVNDLRKDRIPFTPELLRKIKDLYRAEIAYSDAELGRFLDALDEHGFGEAGLLYVSDHGEEFLEHGNLEHGRALHGESVWVPMSLRWPGLEPRHVDHPVQHADVLPTLLPLLGIDPASALPAGAVPFSGIDLLSAPTDSERPLFSHLRLDGPERTAVLLDGYKAIGQFVRCDEETSRRIELKWWLFDTVADPGETVELSDREPVRLGWMSSLVRQRLGLCGEAAATRRDSSVAIDEETRKGLEALGYL